MNQAEAIALAIKYAGSKWSRRTQYDFCNAYQRMSTHFGEFTKRDVVILTEICLASGTLAQPV